MSLIIETDLGHDPDDMFTILWLMAAGVDIGAITITPGDPDQIAIARFIADEAVAPGRSILIGAADMDRGKLSSGSVHHALLKRYGRDLKATADTWGSEVMNLASADELLAIGPLTNTGEYLKGGGRFARATMQGGFVPYSVYHPTVVLDAFLGKEWMPTFNLNGDRRGADTFLSAPFLRRMVGKNVCHTIEFQPEHQLSRFAPPPNRAAELFMEAARLLQRPKRFHDPVAAVCHFHPEVGVWISGKTVKRDVGWTTERRELGQGDMVLVDLDRDAFWDHIYNWNGANS